MKVSKLCRFATYGIVLALGGLALAGPPEGSYHLLKKYDWGPAPDGKEYWDYITFDAARRRLLVSTLDAASSVTAALMKPLSLT